MILYWSDKPCLSRADLNRSASSVEVDPIGGIRSVEQPKINLFALGNGRGLDTNIGFVEHVEFTISEDEYSRSVSAGSQTYFVFELVKNWRRAKFRYIEEPTVNGGEPAQFVFTEIYADTPPGDNAFNETPYKGNLNLFHFN